MKITQENVAWLAGTVGVFLFGSWAFWSESQYFPNSHHGHISGTRLMYWIGVTFVVGSLVGLIAGGAGAIGAKILGKQPRVAVTTGYFLGLNLTALLLLWLFPKMV